MSTQPDLSAATRGNIALRNATARGEKGRVAGSDHPPAFRLPLSTPRASRGAAFSLTEVVIALGIFAVSMVGILALFPVASTTGRESSAETQAAVLAQTILDDLADSTQARGAPWGFLIRGPDTVNTTNWRGISLASNSVNYAAYDIRIRSGNPTDGVGMMGDPVSLKAATTVPTESEFSGGINDSACAYLVRLTTTAILTNNLTAVGRVDLMITAPGYIPLTNRQVFEFTRLFEERRN